MKAGHFMRKANDALASARLLFANGLLDDCCSRAYYAMFDAARAAQPAHRLKRKLRGPTKV